MTKTSNGKNIESGPPHWIEWITGAVSSIIVLAVIIWIGKDAFSDQDVSPNLHGSVLYTEERSGGFQVLFQIRNDSSATAAQVKIRGEVRDQGLVVEGSETVLDYVPGHSTVAGGLVFRRNPAGKEIVVTTMAFDQP